MGRPTGTDNAPISHWLGGRGPGGAQLKQNADGSYMNPWSVNWADNDGNKRTDPLDINCKCFDPNKTHCSEPGRLVHSFPTVSGRAQTQISSRSSASPAVRAKVRT